MSGTNELNQRYNRRQVCKLGASSVAGLTLLGLTGCGSSSGASPTQKTIQFDFWGGASRNKLTKKAIDTFQQSHSDIKFVSQFSDFTSYWKKLSTQIAGGTLPDMLQMDVSYVVQYAKRTLLLDLAPLISDKTIDISDFEASQVAGCKVDNVMYGVSLGGNYQCMVYDTTLLAKAGVAAPTKPMTWDQFAEYTANITKGLGKSVYGAADASGDISNFEIWVRQRGKELYTQDGKLGFTPQDVAEWFNYWSKLRSSGACLPANEQASFANASGAANSPLIHGKSVFVFPHSNEYEGYQTLTKNKLALAPTPSGPQAGLYFKVSMMMSISSKTKYAKECANFINFLVNDPTGVKILGLDRGVPASAKMRAALMPNLTDVQKEVIAYGTLITQNGLVSAKTIAMPPASGQIQDMMQRAAQEVSFGRTSITAGANKFCQDATNALAQS